MPSNKDISDWIDQFVFYDELDDAARLKLSESLSNEIDRPLAGAFEEWKALRDRLAHEVQENVLDRQSLLHFALWRNGNAAMLTDDELEQVRLTLPHYEEALDRSPALDAIVRRIGDEQDDFIQNWHVHAGVPHAERSSIRSVRRRRAVHSVTDFVWRAAAVFVIAAATAALYLGLGVDARTVVVTAESAVEPVLLDDGTLVRLVQGSELTYQAGDGDQPFDRKLKLNGQALFKVAPGDARFVVETPSAITTVWGTTFGLDSDDSFTEVVVAEGRVSVVSRRDPQDPVVLDPGEMTRVVGVREPTPPVRVNITDALSYTKLFVFRDEETFMIADKLSEHFGVRIGVDPVFADEPVTGQFERNWSLDYILQTLARTLDGRVVGSADGGYDIVPLDAVLE